MIGLVGFVGMACADPAENASPSSAPSSTAAAAAASTVSAAPSATPAIASTTAVNDRNKIICRSRVATGSRLAYTRDCHTQMEWDLITRIGRDYINGQQLKAMEAGKPGS
jgi:hypothetical protein